MSVTGDRWLRHQTQPADLQRRCRRLTAGTAVFGKNWYGLAAHNLLFPMLTVYYFSLIFYHSAFQYLYTLSQKKGANLSFTLGHSNMNWFQWKLAEMSRNKLHTLYWMFCHFSWYDNDLPTYALPCIEYNSMRHPTEFHLFVSQGIASIYFRCMKWAFYAHFVKDLFTGMATNFHWNRRK